MNVFRRHYSQCIRHTPLELFCEEADHVGLRCIMKRHAMAVMTIVLGLAVSGGDHSAMAWYSTPDAVSLSRAGLPTEQMAKTVLSAALKDRHPQWNDIPVGEAKIRSF